MEFTAGGKTVVVQSTGPNWEHVDEWTWEREISQRRNGSPRFDQVTIINRADGTWDVALNRVIKPEYSNSEKYSTLLETGFDTERQALARAKEFVIEHGGETHSNQPKSHT